ncbi:hypothetical protein ANN_21249 [Periplaneta americana]|uniref:Uncharacterized protein n=1 Tax=Periplaneta americana TaxID=6978 RepID=A0ABQ8SET1_PERAM|nr:hypothetical protein ANN_21249 [Periplaneta americana]
MDRKEDKSKKEKMKKRGKRKERKKERKKDRKEDKGKKERMKDKKKSEERKEDVSEVVLQTFRDDGEGHMYQFEIRNPGPEMTDCETWTLTLREEYRLRVFENKVLRKIFGAKSDEVTGEWRKLHNTELHGLYSSSHIIRNIKSRCLRWVGHVTRMVNPELHIE